MSNSWRISLDVPEALRFASYVGENENYRLDVDKETLTGVALEWREWWEILPKEINGFVEDHLQMVKARNVSHTEPNQLPTSFKNFGWYPPDFNSLSDTPALQSLLQRYWPKFELTKDMGKMQLVTNMGEMLKQVVTSQIVKEVTREKGKREPNPFNLRIDFVSWPKDYFCEISETHLVLMSTYFDPANYITFAHLLKKQILKLA